MSGILLISFLMVALTALFCHRRVKHYMSFKRPYWLLMFISLGCLVAGYADWMILAPHTTKSEPDLWFWIFAASYFVTPFGVIGFFSSLLWMLVSGFRKH
jgi:hypothetical protein